MKRRVCETCHFFQEAGFAGNGWCHHPQRKATSDVKIVVRRGELACRNGWSHDLWIPRNENAAADIVLHGLGSPGPLPPATTEELMFLVNAQRDKMESDGPPPAAPAVDVVVGEVPARTTSPERPSLLAHDPRSAILKARERYRAKTSAEARRSDPRTLAADHGTAARPVDRTDRVVDHEQSRAMRPLPWTPRGDVPPVQPSEVSRLFPQMTSFPGDDERFSTVPDVQSGIDLPRPGPAAPLVPPFVGAEASVAVPIEPVLPIAESPRRRVPADATSARTADQPEPDPATDESPQPSWRDASVPTGFVARQDVADEVAEPEVVSAAPVPRDRWRRMAAPFRRPIPRPRQELRPEPELLESQARVEEVWTDEMLPEAQFDLGDDELDLTIRIAPDVPRMCRTCRDFRPADSGERGWCTNKWAFSHRRMVDADELPCETSIGCWWLPHDDIWLSTGDVSAHSQPTPLLELWLAHRNGGGSLDAVGSSLRRRQRS